MSNIIFKSAEHRDFYYKNIRKATYPDCYHRALFYTLGISGDTRNHFAEIYDFATRCINSKCLRSGWITSATVKLLRLAFNLFADRTVEAQKNDKLYSVNEIFGNGEYAPYFMQAVLLKFSYIDAEIVGGMSE